MTYEKGGEAVPLISKWMRKPVTLRGGPKKKNSKRENL